MGSRATARCGVTLAAVIALGSCGEPPTVPPPPPELPAGYELRVLEGTTHTVALQQVLQLVLTVERLEGGYDGPVSFTAEAPPGIVVIFRPTTVLVSNFTDVLMVADPGVQPGTYQVIMRGRAPDRPDRSLTIGLTVTAAS